MENSEGDNFKISECFEKPKRIPGGCLFCTPVGDDRVNCGEGSEGWICTRPEGHIGQHVACGSPHGHIHDIARWETI